MVAGKLFVLCGLLLSVGHQPRAVKATDDVANVSPCELESIINQLANPNPEYQLHVSALRNQLRQILRDRQLDVGEEQSLNDYDYPDEDKRSVASLAAQGLLNGGGTKRSLATLARNGQLPTPEPVNSDSGEINEDKRNVGSLARSGGPFLGYGKRNIGSLARDFQLPQNGKRNLATLARLGLLSGQPKRNVAAVAKYNSNPHRYGGATGPAAAEKRNLGALKGSPVHGGVQQKRDEYANEGGNMASWNDAGNPDYMDIASYYMYPSYADLDWGDFSGRMFQKRYLDTSKDPMLFGIDNAGYQDVQEQEAAVDEGADEASGAAAASPNEESLLVPQKRHIGAVYRSGFLPSYRALRSTTGSGFGSRGGGGGSGRFSRSGRARQFVEYYPQRVQQRQPIAAVCKRCFLPYRPALQWSAAGIRGRLPKYSHYANTYDDSQGSLLTNALPSTQGRRPHGHVSTTATLNEPHIAAAAGVHAWGTPPRITAMHRRAYRRPDYHSAMNNYYN